MKKKLLLHIGAGKCGSSALQEYLSINNILMTDQGSTVSYATIGPGGEITAGEAVSEKALSSVFQYSSSVGLSKVSNDSFHAETFAQSLEKIDADVVVLSCEGWINEPHHSKDIFAFNDFDIEVLVYVRAPLEWLNSAWWQWGAWSGVEFSNWLNRTEASTYWINAIEKWVSHEFVNKIHVRLLPEDIIGDFLDLLSIKRDISLSSNQSNNSLPSSVLRFFQSHEELRPTPHESEIDFSLSRRLSGIRSRPDWVIDIPEVIGVLDRTKKTNLSLQAYMQKSELDKMNLDPSWWDVGHYSKKIVSEPERKALPVKALDKIAYEALVSLHSAELEILQLKRELRKVT